VGGCKKELTSVDSTPKIENLGLSRETVDQLKNKKLRLSPSVTVRVETPVKKSASTLPKGIERMESILREDQAKKKTKPAITTSSVTFTTTLGTGGTYYYCYGEMDDPGDTNWWLINTYTWVMTPLGTTSGNTINFYVDKPDLYGSYRLWGENVSTTSGGYTGYQSMGDTYSGVSVNSGILAFTNQAAYDAMEDRLKTAEENHLSWLNQFDSYTDDAAETAATNAGFDDNLPFKEFEAHFGLSSLRAKIQGEVDYWLSQQHSDFTGFPLDNYFPYSTAEQTLINNESQVEIGGEGEGPFTVPTDAITKKPSSYGSNTCMSQTSYEEKVPYDTDQRVKINVGVIEHSTRSEFFSMSRNYKDIGLFWKQKRRAHPTKVYGEYWNAGCTSTTNFDSGYSNSGNHKRSKQEAIFMVYTPYQGIKTLGIYGASSINSGTASVVQYQH